MMHRFLTWLSKFFTLYPIPRREGGLYMERYHRGETHEDKHVFLNKINFKDQDGWHSHPYACFSIILSGSYDEEILEVDPTAALCETYEEPGGIMCTPLGKSVRTRHKRWFNWIPNTRYHRITALHGNVWTLFICGPKHGNSWGFWEPKIGHIHNEEYKQYCLKTGLMWNKEGWWFHDEAYFEHGPFKTRAECKSALDQYGKELMR